MNYFLPYGGKDFSKFLLISFSNSLISPLVKGPKLNEKLIPLTQDVLCQFLFAFARSVINKWFLKIVDDFLLSSPGDKN